eukprot:scaffold92573_cov106-Cyclotella_meneghiniana.AAC.2
MFAPGHASSSQNGHHPVSMLSRFLSVSFLLILFVGPALSAEQQPAHVLQDQSVKAGGLRAAINNFIVKQTDVVSKDDTILTSDVGTEGVSVIRKNGGPSSESFVNKLPEDQVDETQWDESDIRAKAKAYAEQTKIKMQSDIVNSGAKVDPEKFLPSNEEIENLFVEAHVKNGTDHQNVTVDDFYKFLYRQDTVDPNFIPGKELDTCRQMVYRNTFNNESYFDVTFAEVNLIAISCEDEDIGSNLTALGYDLSHFCPKIQRLLPMRFQAMPEHAVESVDTFCNYVIHTLWPIAGEFQFTSETKCQDLLEEIHIEDSILSNKSKSFPYIVFTETFNTSFTKICRHNLPFNPDEPYGGECETQLEDIIALSSNFPNTTSTFEYYSDLCDIIAPLPHPNVTIPLRLKAGLSHKPGEKHKHTKVRHVIADVMFAAQHFRHGIIDEWGNYLEAPPAAGVEEGAVPEQEKLLDTSSTLGRTATNTEKDLACTGAAFTTGADVTATVGPISVGGGVERAFGYNGVKPSTQVGGCGVIVTKHDDAEKYFGFDTSAWTQFFGFEAPGCHGGRAANVKQCRDGQEIWRGPVNVCPNNSVGRRWTNPHVAQWKANDYLVKENDTCQCVCSAGGVAISQHTPRNEPAGKYFKFHTTAWQQFFGEVARGCGWFIYPARATNAKQCRDGKEVWRGEIMACYHNSIGRRWTGFQGGQWKAGDYIVKVGDTCARDTCPGYHEGYYWSVAFSAPFASFSPEANSNKSKKSNPPKPKGGGVDIGIGLKFSVGYLVDTGKVPGFAEVTGISATILFISASIDFTFCCTGSGLWENCNDFAGVAIGVGVELPGTTGVEFTSANVFASPIERVVDVPVNPYTCEGQKWELEIDSAHNTIENDATGTSGMIGVFVFDTEEEFIQGYEAKGLGRHVASRCGERFGNRGSRGHYGHEDYKFVSHFRPYAVQVVNFSGDSFYIDQLWLRRTGGSGGIDDEEYRWGEDNGRGWLLDNDGEAKSTFESSWRNAISDEQERGYNSMTYSIGKGTGRPWDVPCVKSGGDGDCGDKVKLQYKISMRMRTGSHLEVYIDDTYVGSVRGTDFVTRDLYVDYKPTFHHIRVYGGIYWGQINWLKVETKDTSGYICKDSHHDWWFGRPNDNHFCVSTDTDSYKHWEGCNGVTYKYLDFMNNGKASVHIPRVRSMEDGNGTELVAEMTDLNAY